MGRLDYICFQEILKTMRPGDKSGQTCYCIDIPVEITNNTLQLESKAGDVPEDSGMAVHHNQNNCIFEFSGDKGKQRKLDFIF